MFRGAVFFRTWCICIMVAVSITVASIYFLHGSNFGLFGVTVTTSKTSQNQHIIYLDSLPSKLAAIILEFV